MSKYLLEIGVEELPYKFIPSAIKQLKDSFGKFLNENNIGFENINVMATPRRLAVIIEGLADAQPDSEKVFKGPIKKLLMTKTEIFHEQVKVLQRKTILTLKICM